MVTLQYGFLKVSEEAFIDEPEVRAEIFRHIQPIELVYGDQIREKDWPDKIKQEENNFVYIGGFCSSFVPFDVLDIDIPTNPPIYDAVIELNSENSEKDSFIITNIFLAEKDAPRGVKLSELVSSDSGSREVSDPEYTGP